MNKLHVYPNNNLSNANSQITQLYSDKADVSALNSYATKSELTASKNGYPGVKTIKSLSSAGQLTQAGSYHFEAITADVNKDAGTEIFSEYNMGDFYALLLGEDSNSNDGCNFGTLLIASPRINNGIWICTIWQKKMIHWYKIAKISTDQATQNTASPQNELLDGVVIPALDDQFHKLISPLVVNAKILDSLNC